MNNKAQTPIIIDIEASGFGPNSYPIEVGVVLEDGEKYCALLTPAEKWTHWDSTAEDVHHISRTVLERHGKPLKQVAEELNDLLAGRTVYTDGWVVDHPWIIKLFEESGLPPSFKTSALEMILTEDQMHVWHQIKDQVLADMNLIRHRASNDALIVQETWLRSRSETDQGLAHRATEGVKAVA